MPIRALTKVSIKANRIDTRAPKITRARTSRAWSSVPSQLTLEGGLGAGVFRS
ncbi:hypothetical protein D3C81_1424870 [compost metagenome]